MADDDPCLAIKLSYILFFNKSSIKAFLKWFKYNIQRKMGFMSIVKKAKEKEK
jgi:hypothetical protein